MIFNILKKCTFIISGGCVTLRMNLQFKKPKEVIIFPGYLLMHNLLIPSERDESAFLTWFRESSKPVAMIRHGLDIIKTAVDYLNMGQLPVIAFD